MKNVVIKKIGKVTSEGVAIELNEKTSLKTGNIKSKEFWVSWDKIGGLLFDNYTDDSSVDGREKIRGK